MNLTSQDWFIAEFKKPALTIETSPYVGDTVVPLSNWPRIWAQRNYVGLLAAKEI
ncbi:MAG: peptidase M14 [Solibacillus sp.]